MRKKEARKIPFKIHQEAAAIAAAAEIEALETVTTMAEEGASHIAMVLEEVDTAMVVMLTMHIWQMCMAYLAEEVPVASLVSEEARVNVTEAVVAMTATEVFKLVLERENIAVL